MRLERPGERDALHRHHRRILPLAIPFSSAGSPDGENAGGGMAAAGNGGSAHTRATPFFAPQYGSS